jgi:hypothetical protein
MAQQKGRKAVWFWLLCFTLSTFSLPSAAQITCGKGDGPGKVHKHTDKDPNDPKKTLEWYCVDGAYFKIEVKCDQATTCFAKCVFDGGHNVPIPFPGPGGWSKVIWYNWDHLMCGVHWKDTVRKSGETPDQQAERVRKLLIDKGCDFNCYTWTRAPKRQHVRPGAATGKSELVVYRDGRKVRSMVIPPDQVDLLFDGGEPYLAEDPAMYAEAAQGQVGATADVLVDNFDTGRIDARYSALPGSGPLSLVNGSLSFNVAKAGDGLRIDVSDRNHPACLVLDGLDVAPFLVGNGFGILLEFEHGDSYDLQFYQANSVRVKAIEKKADGTMTEVVRTVEGVDLKDVASVQIDWVPSDTLLDRVEIEITTKDGKKIGKKFRSGFKHEAGRTTAYRIRGLDITTDPPILIDRIFYSDVHTDAVDGFTANLHVDNLAVTSMTPANGNLPGTIEVVAIGPSGDPLPERQIVFSVDNGAIAFNSLYGLLDAEGRELTLKTGPDGRARASFLGREPGNVLIHVDAEDGQALLTVPVVVNTPVIVKDPKPVF